jgi:hypothetical protein
MFVVDLTKRKKNKVNPVMKLGSSPGFGCNVEYDLE